MAGVLYILLTSSPFSLNFCHSIYMQAVSFNICSCRGDNHKVFSCGDSSAASVAGISTPTADDTSPSHTMEVPIKILTDATHLDPPMEHMMLQVDTPVEDVVLVEDASSDDDDADSFASVVIEDPLLSVAVTDGSTLSTIEIKEEEPQPPDTSWLEATSPLATNDLKADDVRRPSVHHSPSMITTARCVRKSFDR